LRNKSPSLMLFAWIAQGGGWIEIYTGMPKIH